jgi:hypothetical protein
VTRATPRAQSWEPLSDPQLCKKCPAWTSRRSIASRSYGEGARVRGPGSEGGSRPVSRVLSRTVIHLGRTSPCASSDLPGDTRGPRGAARGRSPPYLVLLRVGFTLPPVLPPARCALTAPFHPYLSAPRQMRDGEVGGVFSVALSVGSRPPGVTWHPALRSPDFPPRMRAERLSGRLPRPMILDLFRAKPSGLSI